MRERLADDRGAIMIIGIFIAVLLVGMMYYVWGIGGSLLHRERMQDAADTAAFGAAVIHARGMNIISLLNIIMAALAAVATALEVIRNIALASAIAATLTCLGCGPWCGYCCRACPYVSPYWRSYNTMRNVASRVGDIISNLIDVTRGVSIAVRHGAPLAGQGLVIQYGVSNYSPTTEAGVMFPLWPELPVEDDPTNWPCDNKVRGPASIFATIGTPIAITPPSEWLLAGYAIGIWTVYSEARDWCPDKFQRVKDGAEMGEDDFQLRTLMYGEPDFDWMRRGVAVASWNRSDGTAGLYEVLLPFTYISFAQSEFYYDDDIEREEWLWHMNWRARMRRFRMPERGGTGDACSVAPEACGSLVDLSAIVVH